MNKCGDCSECCQGVLSFVDHSKDGDVIECGIGVLEGQRCVKYNGACTIYENRPDTCRNFNCLYIHDDLAEWLKPNKSGFIMYYSKELSNTINMVQTKEVPIDDRAFVAAIAWLIRRKPEYNINVHTHRYGNIGLLYKAKDNGV